MNGNITFSICVPNFNYEHYVVDTIQSILDQSYENFEIIVADNASTDNSVQVIKAINDPRIKLFINKYNVGFSQNLDKAGQHASGDYVIMLSSDDRMKPNALETYARLIEEHDGLNKPLVLSASSDIIDGNNNITGYRHAMNSQLIKGLLTQGLYVKEEKVKEYTGHSLLKCVMNGSLISIGRFVSTCYSRQLYTEVEGYSSIMSMMPDAHFSHKIMWQNPQVLFLDEVLFQYRVHGVNNYAAIFQSIKLISDGYHLTQIYSQEELKKIDNSKQGLQINYVKYNVSKLFSMVASGKNIYTFRVYCFLWSAYPELMLRRAASWVFPFSYLLMPLFFIRRLFK